MPQLVENGMPTKYLDEEGLSHVVDLAKKKFADKKELWNWQKTEKAGAVAFTPVPDSVLEPVVEFKFKETLPAEGDKGPNNPSTIEGVDSISVTRCGKNLLRRPYYFGENWTTAGITFNENSDGTVALNGSTSTNNAWFSVLDTSPYEVDPLSKLRLVRGNPYTASVNVISGSMTGGMEFQIMGQLSGYSSLSPACTINQVGHINWDSPFSAETDVKARFGIWPSNIVTNLVLAPQLEYGTEATEYEPYEGTDYTINFNSTYYGGTLNINTGLLTVTWQAVDISTVDLHYSTDNQVFYFDTPTAEYSEGAYPVCESFTYNQVLLASLEDGQFRYQNDNNVPSGSIRWLLKASSYTSVEDFQTAFSGKKLIYKLAEPVTVQLTPIQIKSLVSADKYSPRVNNIYTDAESIQVGYQKFTAEGNFVHTSGDETVNGFKTFSNAIHTDPTTSPNTVSSSIAIKNDGLVKGTVPQHTHFLDLEMLDSSGLIEDHKGRLGSLQYRSPGLDSDGKYGVYMRCWKFLQANDPKVSTGESLFVGYDANDIPYATAPATSSKRVDSTDIVTRGYAERLGWNYQKTDKSEAATFKPVSESSIEPIIEFSYNEVPPAEGEKSPSNPSTITGVSSIKVLSGGKNIAPLNGSAETVGTGVTFTLQEDGGYRIVGETLPNANVHYNIVSPNEYSYVIPANTTLTVSLKSNTANGSIEYQAWTRTEGVFAVKAGNAKIIPPSTEKRQVFIRLTVLSSAGAVDTVVYPQIEVGTASTAYEKPNCLEHAISLGNTYYGGFINLSTGLMTVTRHGLVLDGTEDWWNFRESATSGLYRMQIRDLPRPKINQSTHNFFTHYRYDGSDSAVGPHAVVYRGEEYGDLVLWDTYTNIDDFKAFLVQQHANGTPLKTTYLVDEPYTIQLTPQQIKAVVSQDKYTPQINTLYSDAESVQVGYQRFVDDENAVHKTGNETIDGVKTIANTRPAARAGETVTSLYIRNPEVTRGVPHPTGRSWTQMLFLDANGEAETNQSGRLGMFELVSPSTASPGTSEYMQFSCYKYTNELSTFASLRVGYDNNGTPYSSAPATSNERTGATDILTRGWRITEDEIDEMSF